MIWINWQNSYISSGTTLQFDYLFIQTKSQSINLNLELFENFKFFDHFCSILYAYTYVHTYERKQVNYLFFENVGNFT